MARLTPSSPFASITGKFTSTERIYIRANKHTGQLYGIGMEYPNRVDNPTEAQQQAQDGGLAASLLPTMATYSPLLTLRDT